jgi:hypothetical protein
VFKLNALQTATDGQNKMTEQRNPHRFLNISEVGAEIIILLKIKCEEIFYSKKIIESLLTINIREK